MCAWPAAHAPPRAPQKSAEWCTCTTMIRPRMCPPEIAPFKCDCPAPGAAPGPGIAQQGPAVARAGAIHVASVYGWHGCCYIEFGRPGARCAKARLRAAR
ncbi:hypothetical protein EMIT0158MI4_30584 [Burkholderia ambifaria]